MNSNTHPRFYPSAVPGPARPAERGGSPAQLGRGRFLAPLFALVALAAGAIDIPVDVPARGYVSIQIRNAAGEVVGNAISPEPLKKGRQYVDWDLTGPDDGARAPEGEYTYKAV